MTSVIVAPAESAAGIDRLDYPWGFLAAGSKANLIKAGLARPGTGAASRARPLARKSTLHKSHGAALRFGCGTRSTEQLTTVPVRLTG